MKDLWPQVATLLVALVPAWLAYRSARSAENTRQESAKHGAELESRKVDADAYERAKGIYEHALTRLEAELRRLQQRYDEVSVQLDHEQDVSAKLRSQVDAMQVELNALRRTVAELRRNQQAGAHPSRPTPRRHDRGT